MVYKFDWFSAIVPFGIAEIFDIFSLIMNFSIDYSLLVSTEENPLILSAFVQNKNDSVLWERWRKEENNSFTIIEPRIENQRLYFSKWSKPFLPRDPSHFTDLTKRVPWKNNNLEENWEWVEEWHPEVIPNLTDSDGWAYGRSFIGWSRKKPRKSFFDSTRSRFLVRKRVSDFRSDIKINFDENVKAKGINLVDKIQHGIKISLIKDKKKNDINGRYYFFLADSDENSFQFQNYAPSYFHKIRSLYGINENKYLDAICNKELLGGEKNNAGKSGQIFWRTQNQEFVIKTVTQKEATFLQSNLKIYIEHLENNPHSLISRFFGLHKIKVDRLRLRFVVMNNVFSTCKIPPQLIYDLKGTTEDRLVKQSSKLKKQPILKDLNFADRFILVSKQMSKSLLFQIKNDVNFFLKVGVMDYSLLLGVCVKNEENSEVLSVDTEIDVFAPLKYNQHFASSHISKASVFESGIKGPLGETYFLGIIDFLQEWTKKKKMANVFKTCAFCDCQQNKIDSVPPVKYAERFQEYLDSKIKNTRSLGSYSMGLDKIQNRILINCNSAYDLFVVDSAFSACNPYVLIQYGERQSVTSIKKRNTNPVWGHFCSFPLTTRNPPPFLKFTVLNSDFGFPPTVVGVAFLKVDDLVEKALKSFSLTLLPEKQAIELIRPKSSLRKSVSRGEQIKSRGVLEVSIEKIEFNVADKI